ncbi:MAG: tetratricopeptide repeat protein [Desulfobacteraceae bacterium]|nr:MAG: tetratricopeptide repeat protein [Desulfobacteraceae bacterium]
MSRAARLRFSGSDMYLKIILIVVCGFLWGLGLGCQSSTGSAPIPPQQSAMPPSGENRAAAYYYFSSAQMKLKEGDITEALWLLEKAIHYDPVSTLLKLELAELLLIQKDSEKALHLIQQVLHDDPKNSNALILAARIHQQQEALPEAKAFLERALENTPNDPNIYLYLGRIYWSENDLANAERIFRQMVAQFPLSYAAHYFWGKVSVAQGKNEAAEAAFMRSLELEPSLEEPRLELIKIYQSQKRDPRIIEMYQAILTFNPENAAAALELAVHYRQTGKPEQGLALLTELGQRSQEEDGILSYVFESYLETKQYELAAWVILGMLRGAPENSELHYLAGVACEGLKLVFSALDHLGRVSPDSRFYKNAVVQRAMLLRNSGKLDQSIEVVQNAVQHEPKNADYYLYLGIFYEELEQYKKALEILHRGLAVDNKNIRLHFRVGVIHDKAGHKQDAIAAMKDVLQIQPQDAEALNYLGYTYADLGIHLDEAENLIQNALKMKPDDGYITDSLAWVYYKQGKYKEALRWLTKAEELVPDDPVILEHLGDVHLKLNSHEQALKYYQRSLDIKDNAKDRDLLEEKIRALNHDSSQPKQ